MTGQTKETNHPLHLPPNPLVILSKTSLLCLVNHGLPSPSPPAAVAPPTVSALALPVATGAVTDVDRPSLALRW